MTKSSAVHRSGLVSGCVAGAFLLGACGGGGPSRADVVGPIHDEAVPARFADFATSARGIEPAIADWCLDGDPTAASDRVADARLAWAGVTPFGFGPVMDRRSRFVVDPRVNTDDVREILDGDGPLDAATLRDLYGADQRGLGVLDLLLDTDPGLAPAPRSCAYATAVTSLVAEEADLLATDWVTFGPTLSADEAAANDALGAVVNEVRFGLDGLARDIDDDDGATSAGGLDTLRLARLAALRWAVLGDSVPDSEGIAPLLDDDVVEQLVTEFDAAAADLTPETLMEISTTVSTNVVSSLGLSVQFSDADGDG